mgnify:CR=1 FL=1
METLFTKEHAERLNSLLLQALLAGTVFKGTFGTESTVYDLLHNFAIDTLVGIHRSQKTEIIKMEEEAEEWELTAYKTRKLESLKETKEMLGLLIRYKKNKAEAEAKKAKLATLKKSYADLKEANKTPDEKMKELEEEMAKLETEVVA